MIEDNWFDFIISGNAFEHIEFPWLTMEQIQHKLKPYGIACILTPFNLSEHRYPVDCYRYYPDGMRALAKWAGLTVIDVTTGGVPEGQDINWAGIPNYDDTMLIAMKCLDIGFNINEFPKLSNQIRSKTIAQGG